jgi:hypothetical protein
MKRLGSAHMLDYKIRQHRRIPKTALELCIDSVRETDEDEVLELESDFGFRMLPEPKKIALAKGLRTNTQLRIVHLVNNVFTDSFAFAIASSLVDNSQIIKLDLSKNMFTRLGLSALIEAISGNKSLKHVYLQDQSPSILLTPEDQPDLANRISTNSKLLALTVDGVETPEAKKSLATLLLKIILLKCFLGMKEQLLQHKLVMMMMTDPICKIILILEQLTKVIISFPINQNRNKTSTKRLCKIKTRKSC